MSIHERSKLRLHRQTILVLGAVVAMTFSSLSSPAAGHEGDHNEPQDAAARELPHPDPYGEKGSDGLGVELPEELAECQAFDEYVNGAPSLRTVMGLPDEVAKEEAVVETSLGILVTAKEAEQIDTALALATEFDSEAFFGGKEDDGLMDGRWDYATGTLHVYAGRPLSAEQRDLIDNAQFRVEVHDVDAKVGRGDLRSLSLAIEAEFESSTSQSGFQNQAPQAGIEVDRDPSCGKIMIVVGSAEDLRAAEVAREATKLDAADVVIVRSDRVPSDASRWDHHINDNDGGLIVKTVNVNSGYTGPGTTGSGWCTSAVPFSRPGVSGDWLVTAAHCLTGTNNSGQREIDCGFRLRPGNLSTYLNPANDINNCTQYVQGGNGPGDVVFFAGYSWETGDAETIVNGGIHGRVAMNYYENSIWDSPIGTVTCHSGGNWGGVLCGTLSSRTVTICSNTGCKLSGRVANISSAGGDSGGTVWADDAYNHYAGILIANNRVLPAMPIGDTLWFSHVQRIRSAMTGEGTPVGLTAS